jgi:hypothetical protein
MDEADWSEVEIESAMSFLGIRAMTMIDYDFYL